MKAHYILAVAAAATTVLALAATPAPLPPSWQLIGTHADKYVAGVDQSPAGRGAKFLRSTTDDANASAGLMQTVGAQRYAGQRVRFRARLRTEALSAGAILWMSVNASDGRMLAFYGTTNAPVGGTSAWQERSVVLDVPADAAAVSFGVTGSGTGTAWMEPLAFETVGRDVPANQALRAPAGAAVPPLPGAPTL